MARPKAITDDLRGEVQVTVVAKRCATMQERCDQFAGRTGIAVCTVTMLRAVKRDGVERTGTCLTRAASQPACYC